MPTPITIVNFRSKQPSPLSKGIGGILKKSARLLPSSPTGHQFSPLACVTTNQTQDVLSDEETESKDRLINRSEKQPDLISLSSSMDRKWTVEELQKTDFSPILNQLPGTPMGTPGNTPTETAVPLKDQYGNCPKQSIAKTLQEVALLVAQDPGVFNIAEDELRRGNEIDRADSGTYCLFLQNQRLFELSKH